MNDSPLESTVIEVAAPVDTHPPMDTHPQNDTHDSSATMVHPPTVLAWSERLATGLPQVDTEHRRLIDLINELGGLHQRRATAAELRRALDGLRHYTVYHFQNEADLMQSYPVDAANRRSHLAAHRGFIDCLDRANALVTADPAAVIEYLLVFLVKWLVHHVTGVDARMASEIIALESGVSAGDGSVEHNALYNALIDSVSELYDSMGARTFELLQVNHRLQTEIDRRQRAEEELGLAAIVFETVDEAVMVTDVDNRIIAVNPSFTRITGYSPDEAIGANPRILSGGMHPPEFYRGLWGSLDASGRWQGEIRNRRKNGEFFVEWLSINRVRDETRGGTHYVAVFSDITKHRIEADRIQHLAHYDLLTGLPNRTLLVDRARQALAKARRDKTELALMFLDLDLFKRINDTLGHDVGDLLLQEAATRMQDCMRASDTVARIGGDEFVVLLPAVESAEDALVVAQKIREQLNQPFELAGHSLCVTCSVGVAVYPGHGGDETQLLKNADVAMYRAKKNGRNRVEFYRPEASERVAPG